MNISYLLLFPIIIGVFLQEFFKKQFQNGKKENNTFFAVLLYGLTLTSASFVVQLIIWAFNCFENILYPGTVIYSLGFAVCYVGGTVFSILAISSGPFALTSLIMSYSLLMPTVWGLIFYTKDSAPSVFVIFGILLMCVSLFLVRNKNADGKMKITARWIFFVLANFVSNGGCTIFQTVYNEENAKYNVVTEPYIFMFWAMLFVLITFIVMVTVYIIANKKRGTVKPNTAMLLGFGCGTGVSNSIVNLLVLAINGITIPAYILFPLETVGQLTLVFIVSLLFYKEKYTKLQYVGYFLGMASVVLLNLG